MKAVLEFDLNDQDDKESHMRCINSTEMAIAIFNLKHNLYKRVSHFVENNVNDEDPDAKYQVMEYIMGEINDELMEIDIDKLIS
jgi:hypothetical protein